LIGVFFCSKWIKRNLHTTNLKTWFSEDALAKYLNCVREHSVTSFVVGFDPVEAMRKFIQDLKGAS